MMILFKGQELSIIKRIDIYEQKLQRKYIKYYICSFNFKAAKKEFYSTNTMKHEFE